MTIAEEIEEWIKQTGCPDIAAPAVRRTFKRLKLTAETCNTSSLERKKSVTSEEHLRQHHRAIQRQQNLEHGKPGFLKKTTPQGRAWWKLDRIITYHWHNYKHLEGNLPFTARCEFCK